MKRYRWIIAGILCILGFGMNAITRTVDITGAGQYTSIQIAVQASAHGDTVLVYPGSYVENVNYSSKNITIASLELTTGDPLYRHTTIMDGNHNGATVRSIDPITNAMLFGFTIINGSGVDQIYQSATYTSGGGIYVMYATSFQLNNCTVRDNYASLSGGGVFVRSGTIYMSNCLVTENYSGNGGGIAIEYYGRIVFDPVNRSSVYENTAAYYQDIGIISTRLDCSIYLDMATVTPPTDYYICYHKGSTSDQGNLLVLDVIIGYRTEIVSDIFVSPVGNDTNDGLSPDNPLKSIIRAVQLIAVDSLNSRTIHLASGTYSSSDGQFFPIGLKSYLSLVGDSLSMPILENTHYPESVKISFLTNASLSNLIFEHGNYVPAKVIGIYFSVDTRLKNIVINPCEAVSFGGIDCGSNNYIPSNCYLENVQIIGQRSNRKVGLMFNVVDAELKNVTIDDCQSYGYENDNPWPILYFHGNKFKMENSSITNNAIQNSNYPIVSIGIRLNAPQSEMSITNLLFANNSSSGDYAFEMYNYLIERGYIINSTFSRNTASSFNSPILLNGNLQIANCIFHNDTSANGEIDIYTLTTPGLFHDMLFQNNLIRNYPGSVHYSNGQFVFNEFNFSANPMFCSDDWADPLSYRLGNSSPCIDAGLADTTGLNLPAYDLYGNPRIFNDLIDIGCNEWNYPVSTDDQVIPASPSLRVYPNPFSNTADIRYSLEYDAKIKIKIFNLRGQLIKTITEDYLVKGDHSILWDGKDDQSRIIASGIYLVQLQQKGKPQQIIKLLKL